MSDQAKQLEVKEVEYGGFHPHMGTGSRVAYVVAGNLILFTGTEDRQGMTSTTNAVEEIVERICAAEGINYREYSFYDLALAVRDHLPYSARTSTTVDNLVFSALPDNLLVGRWEPMEIANAGPGAVEAFAMLSEHRVYS